MSTVEPTAQGTSHPKDDLIDLRLSDITAFVRRNRRALLIGAVIGGIIGAIYAFSLPDQYTSQITLLPELQTKSAANLGSLGSLAGLAGIDMNSMAGGPDAVRPELYPNVLQSAPFALAIFKQPVQGNNERQAKPFEQYWQQQPVPWTFNWNWLPQKSDESMPVNNQTRVNGALQLSITEEEMARKLQQRVTANYDKKSGVLTITSTMPDPFVAAQVANLSLSYLTDYVTSYRTEKARREVDFLAKQVAAAKRRYQTAEYELSAYRDRNRSLFLNTAKIEEQRIQAEFLLAQDMYNTLSKQAEMAKIKVQEETPVFKVLEPAQVPLWKSGPKRVVITLGCMLLGLAFTLLIRIYVSFKRSWT